jgi:hypothetical protein
MAAGDTDKERGGTTETADGRVKEANDEDAGASFSGNTFNGLCRVTTNPTRSC